MIHFIALICALISTSAVAADDTAITLRLESLKSSLNARDFDLSLYRGRQLETITRACERETRLGRIPFSCIELRELELKVNQDTESKVFAPRSLTALDEQCQKAVVKLEASASQILQFKAGQVAKLPTNCRQLVKEKAAIAAYKKSGKSFE